MNPFDRFPHGYFPDDFIPHEVVLERQRYEARVEEDRRQRMNILSASKLSHWEDTITRQLVHSMQMSVYGKEHPQRHVIRYPSDWWQALKERFAPPWFLIRYPVEFTEVTASLQETYPDLKISLPDENPVIRFAVVSNNTRSPIW